MDILLAALLANVQPNERRRIDRSSTGAPDARRSHPQSNRSNWLKRTVNRLFD